MTIGGYIPEVNLEAFVTSVSWFSGYDLHPDEWVAIQCGVRQTHTEIGKWYEYSFKGSETVKLRLGRDEPDTGMIQVDIEASNNIGPKIQAALEIMEYYLLTL